MLNDSDCTYMCIAILYYILHTMAYILARHTLVADWVFGKYPDCIIWQYRIAAVHSYLTSAAEGIVTAERHTGGWMMVVNYQIGFMPRTTSTQCTCQCFRDGSYPEMVVFTKLIRQAERCSNWHKLFMCDGRHLCYTRNNAKYPLFSIDQFPIAWTITRV